jgi:CDP-diacylglycerol--serine O-phosphatidyltransferase
MNKIDFRVALPNIITIIGLCLGLNSLKLAFEGNFEKALVFIVLASIVDALDGRIARLIKGTSKFGAELDSLTDFVNFGVCPGILVYLWSLNTLNFYGWIVVLIYIVACCMRLARFNLDININDKKSSWKENFFVGMPSPAAAGMILMPMFIYFSEFKKLLIVEINLMFICILAIISFLMISKIPTYALKKIKITKSSFVLVVLLFVITFSFLFFKILKLWFFLVYFILYRCQLDLFIF